MLALHTRHAEVRAQQRGIPPLVMNWLLDYGKESFDGHGGVVRYFTQQSVRRMERDFGHVPLRRMSEFLRCYLVQGSQDGRIITVGKRHPRRRVWRH